MKKRQKDFPKKKLKVGKHLPKGRNVTDTSFKTKKIVKPDQLKDICGETTLKDLFRYLSHTNASTKNETLNKLSHFVTENKKSLCLHFQEILNKVGGLLLEDDPSVRASAVSVLSTCLRMMSSSELDSFYQEMSSYMHCMMTHLSNGIRKDSLKLLDVAMEVHPQVICRSMKVLHGLLNMISSVVHGGKKGQGPRKRKLDEFIRSDILSQDWRAQVLSRVRFFIDMFCNNKDNSAYEDEDEQEVHVSGEEAVFIPLYLNGGLKVRPLDQPINCNNRGSEKGTKEFLAFIVDLVPLISEVIKGEKTTNKGFSAGRTFESAVISRLGVVSLLLCSLGQWMEKLKPHEKDGELMHKISSIIFSHLMDGFPYSEHDTYTRKRKSEKGISPCMLLNLAICNLYSTFLLGSEYSLGQVDNMVIRYMMDVFRVGSSMDSECIALVLRTSNVFVRCKEVSQTVKNGILLGIYAILEVHRLSEDSKALYCFFIDLCMDYDHQELLNCDGMMTWYQMIFSELEFMRSSKMYYRKFLQHVRKLTAMKPPCFIDVLNQCQPLKIRDLLQSEDEYFQYTIIHLVKSITELTTPLLHEISYVIRESYFSHSNIKRLLELLHLRFLEPHCDQNDVVIFLKFLLNVCCDAAAVMLNPAPDPKGLAPPALLQAMEGCHFQIYPPDDLKKHKELFEVCQKYIKYYYDNDQNTMRCTVMFSKSLLVYSSRFPLQCVLALLNLKKDTEYVYPDSQLEEYFSELLYSCYVYLSYLQCTDNKEQKDQCAVYELHKALTHSDKDVKAVLYAMTNNYSNVGHNELYHILRILLFLINMNCMNYVNFDLCDVLMKKIVNDCIKSDILAPMFYKVGYSLLSMRREIEESLETENSDSE